MSMSFDFEASPFFEHESHAVENLFEAFYSIHSVDNLNNVFICEFTIFSHA